MLSIRLVVGLSVLAAACEGDSGPTKLPGNAALGVAEFQVNATDQLTTIVGVDAQGNEVARLDLVHGRFIPTPTEGDPYDSHEVDGRKLTIAIQGQALSLRPRGCAV